MSTVLTVLVVIVASYGFIVVFAYLYAEPVIFQPRESSYTDAERIFKIQADDGTALSAVFLENPGARFTIFYLHGNAEDLGDGLPLFEDMHQAGFAVAGFDYRGYGTTRGRPTEKNVYADSETVLNHLVRVRGIRPERLILYGRSVGAGPAVELARRHRVGGLVLDGAFTSAFRVVTKVPILPRDRFDNISKIASVRCPVLVIHGALDRTVPYGHGKALYTAALGPKSALWIEDAGHNDLIEQAGERYWQALTDFARSLEH